jgi:DNA replication and repair protein RecF
MQVTSLKLLNYRNYDQIELNFSNHCNLIYGKNGMGKTNLVESIYVLALTKSFRDLNDKVLIKDGRSLTKISGIIFDNISNNYQIVISNDGKKVKINNNLCKKMSDYISNINVVLFSPNDLQFIKDTPNIRRKNINVDISEIDNLYLVSLSNYNKLLKQRNAYLKTMYINSNLSTDYLKILSSKIIDEGLIIYKKRKQYIDLINKYLSIYYDKITGNGNIYIDYKSDFIINDKEKISKKYQELLQQDMLFGKTKFGIHHDDFIFYLNNKSIKDYGSEGQQKNAIISYKLAEIKIIQENLNKDPILILDDLFSELDNEKINNILELLNDNIQTFITTTDIDKLNNKIKNNSKIFYVNDNAIKEVKL